MKCSARVITVNDSIQNRNGNHNHTGNAVETDPAKAMKKVNWHAIDNQDTPHCIVSYSLVEVSPATAVKLLSIPNMKRTIGNIRTRKNTILPLPNTWLTLNIPEEFTKAIIKGDLFLIYNSGHTNGRIIFFCNQKSSQYLRKFWALAR